ncbi:hypothetical protein E2C01_013606 [Portunus trituberculatus]|uniref:Uncharacterized protein n=1 Tax=Portunus trituberculatus TaxID=210409 RepID=A0A5B7DHM7_PORTR|nr:hypothetical protein [Portunus trituberculatus]
MGEEIILKRSEDYNCDSRKTHKWVICFNMQDTNKYQGGYSITWIGV